MFPRCSSRVDKFRMDDVRYRDPWDFGSDQRDGSCVQRVHSSPPTRLSACSDSLCAISDKFLPSFFRPEGRADGTKKVFNKYNVRAWTKRLKIRSRPFSILFRQISPFIIATPVFRNGGRIKHGTIENGSTSFLHEIHGAISSFALWELPTCFHLILNYISRLV